MPLGHADDIGLDLGVLDGPPLAGAAGAGLDLVGDEEDAVTVADLTQFLHEDGGRDDVAALALDGLDEDGGNLLGGEDGFEELFFNVAGAAEGEGVFKLLLAGANLRAAGAAAVGVGVADVGDAGDQRGEAALLLGLGAGKRERAHGAAVEAAEEGDDVLASGVIAGDLEGALDGLGTGVAVVELVGAGHGGD